MHGDKERIQGKVGKGLGCNHLKSGTMDYHSATALDNPIMFDLQHCFLPFLATGLESDDR